LGQATRQGYIVVCPNWQLEGQSRYQYTEGEKQRILACFRDALRRYSINTDRVFITGHMDGATAAWDIAQSHPDLWAGAVMISPTAEKYILLYNNNLKASPDAKDQIPMATYVVYGEKDATRVDPSGEGIGTVVDRYLKSSLFDCTVVEHIGQPRGMFAAELPRIMQWMQLSSHQRLRAPRILDCTSLRPGDRFFYWLEAASLAEVNSTNPIELDKTAPRGAFEARLLERSQNGVRITKIPSQDRGAIVWLTPEMVDFSQDINIFLRDKKTRHSPQPDIAVMLEDVRTRGDRQNVFWQVVRVGNR
jgi:predicted esterase